MDITIQNQNEQALLHRTDYVVRVFAQGATPSRGKLIERLAKELKAKKDLLVVRRIRQTFGDSASFVDVSVYQDGKSMEEFEQTHMKARHEKAAPKKEEKPAEEAPQEAAEEKKEAEQ